MKGNFWIKVVAIVIVVLAVYLAFDIIRGVSHYNRGTNHLAEGEYDQAIVCFDKAIKVEGKFPEAYCHRGIAYYEKGLYDEAIKDFDRAIEQNPEFAEAYYNRAMVYFYDKQYDKSWGDVDKAQRLGYSVSSDFLEALRKATGKGINPGADVKTKGRL